MFWYASGKLRRVYDESLAAAAELQRGDSALYRLDPIDFGRRVAAEKELLAPGDDAGGQNAVFDDSGNFLIYSTLLGIKARARRQPPLPASRGHRAHCRPGMPTGVVPGPMAGSALCTHALAVPGSGPYSHSADAPAGQATWPQVALATGHLAWSGASDFDLDPPVPRRW